MNNSKFLYKILMRFELPSELTISMKAGLYSSYIIM